MISNATVQFWKCFNQFPEAIQEQAKIKYGVWHEDPYHPSLHFKPLRGSRKLWSVRVNRDYRAVGYYKTPSHFVWVWIGAHDDYDKLSK